MQVFLVNKNMVKQSSTVPLSIHKEYLNHTLGLTLSTPGLFHIVSVNLNNKVVLNSMILNQVKELVSGQYWSSQNLRTILIRDMM